MTPDGSGAPHVEVDHELCVGSQMCISIAPRTFALDDGGQSVVVDPAGDPLDDVREAEENCPVAAIWLRLSNDLGDES